jgi:hypothetical protein
VLPNPEEAFCVPSTGIVVETNVEAGYDLSPHSIDSSTAWRAPAMPRGVVRTPRANVVFMYEEHVSIDRLWAFVRSGEELDTNERSHLDKCSYCVCALGLCIISDGPSAVEKKLREQFEGDEK